MNDLISPKTIFLVYQKEKKHAGIWIFSYMTWKEL